MKKNIFTMIDMMIDPVKQKIRLLCLILVASTSWQAVMAQVSIAAHNTDYTTNLNSWNGVLPSGFTRSSNNNYVGTASSTTGGVYAISGAGFGYRPSSNATATTCSLTGSYQNNTGSAITSIQISYQAFQVSAAASRTPNWSVTSTLPGASALSWTFNASTSPGSPSNQTATLPVNIPAGGTFTITFSSDRGGGAGSSPLIGLNNIKVKSIVSCAYPTNLAENNVTSESADFIWDAQGSNAYEYVLSQTATNPTGAGTATNATTYSTTELSPLTDYYFFVRTDCGSGTFSAWTMVNFTTPAIPCPEVTGTAASNVTSATADIAWDVQGSNGFEYVLDQNAADPSAAGTAIATTSYNATALEPSTQYYFHIRTDCGSGNYSDWTTIDFTTTCPTPTGGAASNVTHESADLAWDAQGSNGFEYVLDQNTADPSAAGTAITGTAYSATGLESATAYYFHIRTDCGDGDFSPWATVDFTTICPTPTGVAASNVTSASADLAWDAQGSNAFEYVLDQNTADPSAAGTAITATSYDATGLESSTQYYFHVRTDCGDGSYSEWATIDFTTTCPIPTGASVPAVTHESADITWDVLGSNGFEYVLDQDAIDPTGAGTATATNSYSAAGLESATTYHFHIRTDCGDGDFSQWTTIDFTTTCPTPLGAASDLTDESASFSWDGSGSTDFEYVLDQDAADPTVAGTATTETSYDATGLESATTYYFHVRTDCGNGSFSDWATIESMTTCPIPTGAAVSNPGLTSADLSWDALADASGYAYVVDTEATDPATAGTATAATTATISTLTASTTYFLHVRTDCGNGSFSPWTTVSFTTATPCATPTGVSVTNITDDAANLSWTSQASASGYEYTVNQSATSPTAAGTSTTTNSAVLNGLTTSTGYYAHIRANCGNGNFSDWVTIAFTTASDAGLDEVQALSFNAYPNPAKNQVTIQSQAQEGTITLISLHGQQLRTIDLKETSTMELSGIEHGLYILLYEMNGVSSPVRLVVE